MVAAVVVTMEMAATDVMAMAVTGGSGCDTGDREAMAMLDGNGSDGNGGGRWDGDGVDRSDVLR